MAANVTVKCPLGADVFQLLALKGQEQISTLYHYDLQLLSLRANIKLSDLVGQDMTVVIDADGETKRYIHGHVSDVIASTGQGRYAGYQVAIKPWFWFLTRTANCRIFQKQTVPDIIKALLKERGIPELDDTLTATYPTCEYVVQYRESDYNFIARLMEREGIYYFFRHQDGKHTLVLADGYGGHQATAGWEKLPYFPPNPNMRRERDHIDEWSFTQSMQTANVVINDYDFLNPTAELEQRVMSGGDHEHDEYEAYDYPGEYTKAADGEQYVGIRHDEVRTHSKLVHGGGNVRNLCVGALFTLTGHTRDDQNREYICIRTQLDMAFGDYESSGAPAGSPYLRCSFSAIDSTRAYRAPRITPRPVVHGPQTATVVGKSGEEIWTDEHGRVKVQFHWDRLGKSNENSSCWVRVSQAWAGAGWGTMHVPRIGQEVVVSFLEGNPDRPLITGRVYNGNNRPPFGLPGKGMVSGVKSNTTPKGGGYNEFSLDDTKGNEKIIIHGQFDMNSTIEHDQTLLVKNNRTDTINVNDTETVGANQAVTVGANQTVAVTANQSITVGGNHSLTVSQASAETIVLAKALSIGAAYQVSVGAVMNETVVGAKMQEIGAGKMVGIGGQSIEKIKGGKVTDAKGQIVEKSGAEISVTAAKKMGLNAGEDLSISGKTNGLIKIKDQLTIKVGSAEIIMKKSGEITIKGKKITVDAGGNIQMDAKKILQNS